MRSICPILFLFFFFSSLEAGADDRIYLNPDAPKYVNTRFGLSFDLPPGQWSVLEKKGASQVEITDGVEGDLEQSLISVSIDRVDPSFSLESAYAAELRQYAQVWDNGFDPGRGTFFFSAKSRNGRLIFVLYNFQAPLRRMLFVLVPESQKPSFDLISRSISRSFATQTPR